MRLHRLTCFGLVLLACCFSVGTSRAASFSFSGIFNLDSQFEFFQFTAPSNNVTLRTWSYAGGTDAHGDMILPGGFDTNLTLFDVTTGVPATSPLIDQNNDGAGVATDPTTGLALDAKMVETALNAGHIYRLVLTESDNLAIGPDLSNGFTQTGAGNFTPGEFGCGAPAFCDAGGNARTGNFEVDIVGVGAAMDITTTTPEPSSLLLLAFGLSGVALIARRGKHSNA